VHTPLPWAMGDTKRRKLLSRGDRDLDCGIRPKIVSVFSMKFRVPMANPARNLTDKVKAAFLSQVSEIANQVCDGMLVSGAAVLLINRDGLGGPGNVVCFIGHALSSGSDAAPNPTSAINLTRGGTHVSPFSGSATAKGGPSDRRFAWLPNC
jgi:hypothetical protein